MCAKVAVLEFTPRFTIFNAEYRSLPTICTHFAQLGRATPYILKKWPHSKRHKPISQPALTHMPFSGG